MIKNYWKKLKLTIIGIFLVFIFVACGGDDDYSIGYGFVPDLGYITVNGDAIYSSTTINHVPDESVVIEAYYDETKRIHFLGWRLYNYYSVPFLGHDLTICYDNPYSFIADAVIDTIVPCFEYERNSIIGLAQIGSTQKIVYYSNHNNNHKIYLMDLDGSNKKDLDINLTGWATAYDFQFRENNNTIVFCKDTSIFVYKIDTDEKSLLYKLPEPIEFNDFYQWQVDEKLNYFMTVYYCDEGYYRYLIYDLYKKELIDNSIFSKDCVYIKKIRFIGESIYFLLDGNIQRYNINTKRTRVYIDNGNIIDFEKSPQEDNLIYTESNTGLCKIIDIVNGGETVLEKPMYLIESWSYDGDIAYINSEEVLIYNVYNKTYKKIIIDALWKIFKNDTSYYLSAINGNYIDIFSYDNNAKTVNLSENW